MIYDNNSNPTVITPATDQIHRFDYNLVAQVTTYTAPELDGVNNLTSYDYNNDGQSVSVTTPDTKRVDYNYDETKARLDSIDFASENGNKSINFIYDDVTDQLTSMSLDNNSLSYTYDGGLLLSETSSGDIDSVLSFEYDEMLRVDKVTVNNDETSYNYNYDGQLTSAGDIDYTYDDNGFLTKSSLSNFEESYSYNNYGELSSSTNNIYDLSYTYDGIGRIKTITSSDGVTEYFYDSQSRISSVKLDSTRKKDRKT